MDPNSIERVIENPYIVCEIMRRLDIRSLFRCHSVCRGLYSAAGYESEKRKDIIHLYLLNHNPYIEVPGSQPKDVPVLLQSFLHYTQLWLNIKPKYVILMVGGYRQKHIDYRKNVLQELTRHLPKNCTVIFLDVGHNILTSSIRYKSLTNYSEESSSNPQFQRTAFPCLSCLIVPDIKGVQIKTYKRIEDIDKNGVKSVILFLSAKKLSRKTGTQNREEIETTTKGLSLLMSNLNYDVSFGGGAVDAVQSFLTGSIDEPLLRDHLFVTFGGNCVRTASSVISTRNDGLYQQKLEQLKAQLDFDCEDSRNSITIGYIFANKLNFSHRFSGVFQKVFPNVGIYGFQTNQRMYGKDYTKGGNSLFNSHYDPKIDPLNNSVVVLVNIESKKDFTGY